MPVFGPGGGKDEQSDIGHVHFEVAGYKFGDHLVKCDKFSHGRRWAEELMLLNCGVGEDS